VSHPIRLTEKKDSISLSIGDRRLDMKNGDVVTMRADALVCPVDQNLDFRSGLARIISQHAGQAVRQERPMFPEPFGKVVVLPGGKLHAKYIFLTVLLGQKEPSQLTSSVREAVDRSIRYAEFLRLQSLAFPVLGCPKTQPPYALVSKIMLEEITQYFHRRNTKIKMILFSAFNVDAFEAFRKEARDIANL